ncbi:hypothetical protein T12_3010 [Trichinella patagoniensis]|uniref:Uncharacterized protein n=1 Tax=Trichinella patagoniensis TaxID=990121 RepID=A0A0V0Z648_9BILA|nr:hypothetical protein T12_3010 [Trichinella patagoniensis]
MPGYALLHCVGEPVLCLLSPGFSFANGWCSDNSVHCIQTQYTLPFQLLHRFLHRQQVDVSRLPGTRIVQELLLRLGQLSR